MFVKSLLPIYQLKLNGELFAFANPSRKIPSRDYEKQFWQDNSLQVHTRCKSSVSGDFYPTTGRQNCQEAFHLAVCRISSRCKIVALSFWVPELECTRCQESFSDFVYAWCMPRSGRWRNDSRSSGVNWAPKRYWNGHMLLR